MDVSTLLLRNLSDVFAEIDPVRRRKAIDEIWHEDGVFYDPNSGPHRGRDEIDRIAGKIKATHTNFRYQPISAPEERSAMAGESVGCPARQASRPSTPEPISSSPATAKLPPSICFLTSFLELDKAATRRFMNTSVTSALIETAKTHFEES